MTFLTEHWRLMVFSQNRGKEELLMHLVGEGSFADRRLVRDGKVSLPGRRSSQLRGTWAVIL